MLLLLLCEVFISNPEIVIEESGYKGIYTAVACFVPWLILTIIILFMLKKEKSNNKPKDGQATQEEALLPKNN